VRGARDERRKQALDPAPAARRAMGRATANPHELLEPPPASCALELVNRHAGYSAARARAAPALQLARERPVVGFSL